MAMQSDAPSARLREVQRVITRGLAFFLLALGAPFEAIVTWSAWQVVLNGIPHVLNFATQSHVSGIALARAHPIQFGLFGIVSIGLTLAGWWLAQTQAVAKE
jgi:hypothetical protein